MIKVPAFYLLGNNSNAGLLFCAIKLEITRH